MSTSWERAHDNLIETICSMGYPQELAEMIAKNLGSEKTMNRMTAYLLHAQPSSAEEIVDEMLAIMDDRERWVKKKQAEYYNAKYNELMYNGLDAEE